MCKTNITAYIIMSLIESVFFVAIIIIRLTCNCQNVSIRKFLEISYLIRLISAYKEGAITSLLVHNQFVDSIKIFF